MARRPCGGDDVFEDPSDPDDTFLGVQMRLCARIIEEGPDQLGLEELQAVDRLVSQLKNEKRYRACPDVLTFRRPRDVS